MRISPSKIHDKIYDLRQRLIIAEEKMEDEVEGSPEYAALNTESDILQEYIEFLETLIS